MLWTDNLNNLDSIKLWNNPKFDPKYKYIEMAGWRLKQVLGTQLLWMSHMDGVIEKYICFSCPFYTWSGKHNDVFYCSMVFKPAYFQITHSCSQSKLFWIFKRKKMSSNLNRLSTMDWEWVRRLFLQNMLSILI